MKINLIVKFLKVVENNNCTELIDTANPNSEIFKIYKYCGKQFTIECPINTSFHLNYKIENEVVTISDYIPEKTTLSDLDVTNLYRFISYSISSGFFEFDKSNISINKNWKKMPPGSKLECKDNTITVTDPHTFCIQSEAEKFFNFKAKDLKQEIRSQLIKNIIKDIKIPKAAEFSGGIDSGIIFHILSNYAESDIFSGAFYYEYPYHEFRNESIYRNHISNHSKNSKCHKISDKSGTFFNLEENPIILRPTIASTYQFQLIGAMKDAAKCGAMELLNGIGGDLLFLVDPRLAMKKTLSRPPKNSITQDIYCAMHDIANDDIDIIVKTGGYWSPYLLNIPSNSLVTHFNKIGLEYRSPYMEKNIFLMIYAYWHKFIKNSKNENVQKPIAYDIFGDMLPDAVWRRPGKVDHTGNIYRDAIRNKKSIINVVESSKDLCELLKLNHKHIEKIFLDFTAGIESDNAYLSYLISIFSWWHCFKKNNFSA